VIASVVKGGTRMDNASMCYEEIISYADIKDLIGTPEEIFIDFKQTTSRNGKMTEDDKANFSRAASGFAHQQGGVLIWGISTEKDGHDIGRATIPRPIYKVEAFCSALRNCIRRATDPPVDGIQNRIIYEHDKDESNVGFVVSFFPKSDAVHMSLIGNAKNAFYKRHGDGFHSLTTDEIKALFFRELSPDLKLKIFPRPLTNQSASNIMGIIPHQGVVFGIGFAIENVGKGIAKNCSARVLLLEDSEHGWGATGWYDAEGSTNFRIAQLLEDYDIVKGMSRASSRHIKLNPGVVICPEEEMGIAMVVCKGKNLRIDDIPMVMVKVKYKIFAENMVPVEETTDLKINLEDFA